MRTHAMIATQPDVAGSVNEALVRLIDEALLCAQTRPAPTPASPKIVDSLRQCIRLNLDCADVGVATGIVSARWTGSNKETDRMLEASELACRLCGEECERHSEKHEYWRICADACRRCDAACQEASRCVA